ARSDTTTDNNHDGLGPRLGFLTDQDGNTQLDLDDVVVTTFMGGSDGVQFDMHLGQSFTVTLPFVLGFSVGGPGLDDTLHDFGFDVQDRDGAQLTFTWDWRFGFGLTPTDLFYVHTDQTVDIADPSSAPSAELVTHVHVTLPGLDAGVTLGLLDGRVRD